MTYPMMKDEYEKWLECMKELQATWDTSKEDLLNIRHTTHGIRSSQLGALVLYLVRKKVI